MNVLRVGVLVLCSCVVGVNGDARGAGGASCDPREQANEGASSEEEI